MDPSSTEEFGQDLEAAVDGSRYSVPSDPGGPTGFSGKDQTQLEPGTCVCWCFASQ